MRCSLFGPLAAALLLSVASSPCPAGWLDDTTHNVGVEEILAPRGTIDSGGEVTPVAVVANYGTSAESLWTFMAIDDGTPGGFLDSLWLTGLAPAERETVAFLPWIPRGRDSMEAIAWTECVSDTFPQDDTAKGRFLVRVFDVSLQLQMSPDTVVDSGVPILPQARVWNGGNLSISGYLQFRVDSTYYSRRDINLIAGGATIVTAPDPWYPMPGHCVLTCSLFILPSGACVASDVDTVDVRGTPTVDVDARAVLAPTGVIDTTMTIVPEARYGNNGVDSVEFWTFFIIRNSSGAVIYAESCQVPLGPNRTSDVEYPSIKFHVLGNYTAACSVHLAGDQNSTNDVKYAAFRVVPLVTGDIGVVAILSPPDLVPPDSSIIPTAVLRNYSVEDAILCVLFSIRNRYGVLIYCDELRDLPLPAGEDDTFCFIGVNVGGDTGTLCAICYIAAGDTNPLNDTLRKWFRIGYPGIEEVANSEGRMANGGPTILSGASGVKRLASCVVFDAMGRRVRDPKPGVYFVVSPYPDPLPQGERENGALSVRKVIVQR